MTLYLIVFVVAALHALLAYYVTSQLIGSILIGVVQAILFMVFVVPMIQNFMVRTRKRHECYRFINSFIISLSVVQSGEAAYESTQLDLKGEEKKIMEGIKDYGIHEKLDYLKNYFLESYYGMFLSMYDLYEEQGGDILAMTAPLLEEATQVEEAENAKGKIAIGNFIQTIIMWLLGDIIVIFIRTSLANFYETLSVDPRFYMCIFAYFLFQGLALLIYAKTLTEENLVPAWLYGLFTKKGAK